MLKTTLRALGVLLAVAVVATLAFQAPATADDEAKKIQIKKIVRDCDGENCPEGEHRVVFVGDDGEVHELGEGGSWMMAEGHGPHAMHHGPYTFLGVELTELSSELRSHFGASEDQGVLVARVMDDSPAARAGVRVGDVITAVDGEAVAGAGSLGRLIRKRQDGETIALEVIRDGRIETLSPTLAKREASMMGEGPMMKVRKLAREGFGHHDASHVMVRCKSEGGDEKDCEVTVGGDEMAGFDCGGADNCEVQVECNDGACDCTANGESVDCDTLPGFSERHGE